MVTGEVGRPLSTLEKAEAVAKLLPHVEVKTIVVGQTKIPFSDVSPKKLAAPLAELILSWKVKR